MTDNNLLDSGYFNLSGQVALVTGASSGLGEYFATVLARAGCKVAITARRRERLDSLAANLGGNTTAYSLDVTDAEAVGRTLAHIRSDLGPVSILVNNAGIGLASSFLDAEEADTRQTFETNQQAVWQVAQLTARQMVAEEIPGSIINIASVLGLRVMSGAASYSVSKAAVVQMTKAMALELARYNIRANALAPGYFPTEMNSDFLKSEAGAKVLNRSPMRRAGEYEELQGIVLLLASARSSFITGTVIPVDGGHSIGGL